MKKKNLFLISLLLVAPVMADQHCIKPKTNYERNCAAVTNLNNLPAITEVNGCAIITVQASSHWNASGLRLQKGHAYRLEVAKNDQWCDASVVTDSSGWLVRKGANTPGSGKCPDNGECGKCKADKAVNGPVVDLGGLVNGFIKASSWLRRNTDHKLFSLIGIAEGELSHEEFAINQGKFFTPKHDAEFCAYANDLSFMYGNNSGALTLTITRTK